ncbi:MAG: VOC family protein [Clostridia bacterium]|nr:VOC family protein [Clostridia bacterium]
MKVIMTLNRIYVSDLDQAIEFYEKLFNEQCISRFQYSEASLELARVGNALIISGSEEVLKPFRSTQATFLVDDIQAYKDFLLENGGEIIRDLRDVPTGVNMTVKHADGTIVEYVEHRRRG